MLGSQRPEADACRQIIEIHAVVAMLAARDLKVFGQPFVEPERQVRQHRVEIAVRHFMAKIDRHMLAPLGIDGQPCVGLDEERPPVGELRKSAMNERAESFAVLEQIDVDRLVGGRQA